MPTNNLKHIGSIINTQRRCVVVFREIPDEPTYCLIVDTDALPDWMHDDIMHAVESPAGQESNEFYEYAARTLFSDGTQMLNNMHSKGLLQRQPVSNISMTPNRETAINLADLNDLISQQNGGKPAVEPSAEVESSSDDDVALDNVALAQNMLKQASGFEAEAKRLRTEAFDLAPELKPKRGRKPKAKSIKTETVK
jgi:hypothetical protein